MDRGRRGERAGLGGVTLTPPSGRPVAPEPTSHRGQHSSLGSSSLPSQHGGGRGRGSGALNGAACPLPASTQATEVTVGGFHFPGLPRWRRRFVRCVLRQERLAVSPAGRYARIVGPGGFRCGDVRGGASASPADRLFGHPWSPGHSTAPKCSCSRAFVTAPTSETTGSPPLKTINVGIACTA